MKAKAIITTKYEGHGYRPLAVERVETYTVDSAMDTDADSWSIQLGDIDNDLLATLKRDNEVRVSLYGISNSVIALSNGFADQAAMSEDGTLVIDGRDITAPAVDSIAEPGKWKWVRPEQLIAQQARALQIGGKLDLVRMTPQKNIYTDGSETYWEFWYRFVRKRAAWIWAEADGSIRAGKLNYDTAATYKFGSPAGMKSSVSRENWIPVESVTFTKTTQKRVGEMWVIGHRGTIPFIAKTTDVTTKGWIKRPRKIVDNSQVKSKKEAIQEAWEEIFETKVGSVEISLTVFNPGFIIRQNRVALVNIPKMGLRGEYFVVGAKTVGSNSSGVWQEIRLREKQYAISRRVPTDPKLAEDPQDSTASSMGANLGVTRQGWGDFFVQATNKYHGAWDFNLFLAILLAIGEHESGFMNKREGGDTEWYARPDKSAYLTGHDQKNVQTITGASQSGTPADYQRELLKWENLFANSDGNVFNPFHREAGVGPMQLTTATYKTWADEFANKKGEYDGGRWQPKFNILAGARAFAGKLTGIPVSDINIYEGVRAYNGAGPAAYKYMRDIKQAVDNTWLPAVQQARLSAKSQNNAVTGDVPTNSKELRQEILNNPLIKFDHDAARKDIQTGQIADVVMQGILIIAQNWGYNINNLMAYMTISALKSDHDTLTTEGRVSAHSTGHAVDLGRFTPANSTEAMMWLNKVRTTLNFKQLIGPNENLVYPRNYYDDKTLGEHKNHIHLGW